MREMRFFCIFRQICHLNFVYFANDQNLSGITLFDRVVNPLRLQPVDKGFDKQTGRNKKTAPLETFKRRSRLQSNLRFIFHRDIRGTPAVLGQNKLKFGNTDTVFIAQLGYPFRRGLVIAVAMECEPFEFDNGIAF